MTTRFLFSALLLPVALHAAATIVIVNNNAAGVGFNDATPAAPVGGNTGTTLGQQRLNAFSHAANIWGATLTSSVPIVVQAQFTALTCTATGAVLGSAGPTTVHANFVGAPFTGFWYHQALANKLFGADLAPANVDINANFNSNLGQAGCLTGTFFYLGLDNNHGTNIDLVTVLLHEFGHGLGFSTVTSGTSGTQISGLPSIFDRYLLDTTVGLTWNNMTNAQRVTSAINNLNLVWNGAIADSAALSVLTGIGEAVVTSTGVPVNVAGTYLLGQAGFGAVLTNAGVMADLMPVADQGAGAGCTAFNAANTLAVNGKIALIDRGICGFTVKAKNAQLAGTIAVIIANNVAGAAPALGGSDPTVTIPTVSISQADAITLKDALRFRSRTRSGVVTKLRTSPTVLSGVDPSNRPRMFAPNPFQGGSSLSHWDTSLFRNQLMEPSINGDLTHSVIVPFDMTFALLLDLGW